MATIALNPQAANPETTQPHYGMVRRLLVDTLVPWAAYTAATRWLGCTPVHALMLSAVASMLDAAQGLRRGKAVSPVAILVSLGLACSMGAMLLGGSAQILLLRESLLTAVVGFACLLSLPARRPLMFFFIRYFVAGTDAEKLNSFNRSIDRPGFRRVVRTVTAVWGCVFLAEFALRAWLVFHCSASTVLLVSPVLMNGIVGSTVAWNVWYGKRQKAKAAASAVTAAA